LVKYQMALIAAALTAMAAFGVQASSAPKEGKELPPSIATQHADLQPPPIVADRIGGLKIIANQVMYPGVPDRAACRFVIRAVNNGSATVSAYTLLRTLDGEKSELNTWMVPTGSLAPGQASERLYSCKNARYLVIDQQTLEGWPGRCMVNGEERSPCPLTLALEANLNIVAK
jgi:hypothetical protein